VIASTSALAAAPDDDVVRSRLLSAAAEVFAEKGYDRAGVAEIARRAGYTTGAIYGRFTGKAELLLAAVECYSDDELDALFNEHRFEGKITDILTTVGSHLVDTGFDSGQALLLEAVVASRRDPEVRRLLQERLDLRSDRLADLIEEAKVSGAIDSTLDSEALVRFCHAVGFGFLVFRAIELDLPAAPPWEALISRLVEALDPSTVLPGEPTV
jgi:AcrR family transcriptional regulator